MPENMSHFTKGLPAIVEYTYSQRYGGNDIKSYSLLVRESDNNWNSICWYDEEQLEVIKDVNFISVCKTEISKQNPNNSFNF